MLTEASGSQPKGPCELAHSECVCVFVCVWFYIFSNRCLMRLWLLFGEFVSWDPSKSQLMDPLRSTRDEWKPEYFLRFSCATKFSCLSNLPPPPPFCCLDLTPGGVVAFIHTHPRTKTIHTHTHTHSRKSELGDAGMRCQWALSHKPCVREGERIKVRLCATLLFLRKCTRSSHTISTKVLLRSSSKTVAAFLTNEIARRLSSPSVLAQNIHPKFRKAQRWCAGSCTQTWSDTHTLTYQDCLCPWRAYQAVSASRPLLSDREQQGRPSSPSMFTSNKKKHFHAL